MPINLVRVINENPSSVNSLSVNLDTVLIDKIDRSQSNFTNYAQIAKQKIYVPKSNPANPAVKGYVDLVPTDEVLLSYNLGTISGLTTAGVVSTAIVASNLVTTSTITAASNAAGTTTITGTTFLSVAPDITYVILTNLTGDSQTIPSSGFSAFLATQIDILDGTVTIGVPGAGWTAQVFANSKYSNTFTL
jgi:hypothetical protein